MDDMATKALWNMEQLVRRVAAALAGPTYPGAPNRRVRNVPDRRAVRWYVTIGLVDRPAAMRGRTALYGTRHLLQIVAVKRRQAQGHSLAEIQAELAGATDETLRRVAMVPGELISADAEPTPRPAPVPAEQSRPGPRPRFWTDTPRTGDVAAPPGTADRGADSVTMLAAVHLPGGALLLLPRQPDADEISAIQAAARPLLDVLADHGLLSPEERSPS